jgi:glycerophosphoryl diester phosphodiesterase
LIIGHRGASALAPENTLVAFTRALDDGAAGIELDVRLDRDGVPVVIHDATLRRTGLCEGAVADLTSNELGRTDVGTWFNQTHPLLARTQYCRQFVPTLKQVFELFRQRPGLPEAIYVEMKTDQAEETSRELARAVAQLVLEYDLRTQVIVVSFNLKAIAHVKKIDPALSTGALFEPRRNPLKTLRKHPMITGALGCSADQILLHRLVATRRLVDLALANNLRPVIWTVDDPNWVRRRTKYGIHAVITNKPAEMLAALS